MERLFLPSCLSYSDLPCVVREPVALSDTLTSTGVRLVLSNLIQVCLSPVLRDQDVIRLRVDPRGPTVVLLLNSPAVKVPSKYL